MTTWAARRNWPKCTISPLGQSRYTCDVIPTSYRHTNQGEESGRALFAPPIINLKLGNFPPPRTYCTMVFTDGHDLRSDWCPSEEKTSSMDEAFVKACVRTNELF
jgi:hypothetical protein